MFLVRDPNPRPRNFWCDLFGHDVPRALFRFEWETVRCRRCHEVVT